jgi:hypothetical protein
MRLQRDELWGRFCQVFSLIRRRWHQRLYEFCCEPARALCNPLRDTLCFNKVRIGLSPADKMSGRTFDEDLGRERTRIVS